jgi:hypothetical protein
MFQQTDCGDHNILRCDTVTFVINISTVRSNLPFDILI